MLLMNDEKNGNESAKPKAKTGAPTPKVESEGVEVEFLRATPYGDITHGAGSVGTVPAAVAKNLIKQKLAKKTS